MGTVGDEKGEGAERPSEVSGQARLVRLRPETPPHPTSPALDLVIPRSFRLDSRQPWKASALVRRHTVLQS